MSPPCKSAASFSSTSDRPVQPSHSIGYSPGYIRPTARRFGCRPKSGGTSSKHPEDGRVVLKDKLCTCR
ncbi:hypothetical protein EG68_11187 [Paragonimus skrjabini miyazakii]|uniref:Uncharacterized protein n=1 Tax=Paragonimus skrjabini miyazakii TaxID=59628 RepID=A0A8S9YJY7_9TREM|nr:hypothetical protein EG68_11187 [Paragonimus skrjabini miyazakii]